MSQVRLDQALVARGLVESRTKAKRRIDAGDVLLNGVATLKASVPVGESDTLEVQGEVDYVGRGALKLIAALDAFAINPSKQKCLDLGASTGGFTQVLLDQGASQVVALDVGHGQLHPSLVADPRVLSLEGENAKELTPARWQEIGVAGISLVVADLSFISLTHVIEPVVRAVGTVPWVALIKPQFEVGRERLSHGIAKQRDTHESAILNVVATAEGCGLYLEGLMHSPISGELGNQEYLCYLSPTGRKNQTQWSLEIHSLTHS